MSENSMIHELLPEQENDGTIEAALVTRVVDADTIEVMLRGDTVDVRLLLVDAPETVHPDQPVEKFGLEAYAFSMAKVTGKKVLLEYDGPKWDSYGRLLAYVWVDGRMLNEMLLEAGLAEVRYIYHPPYKYYDLFTAAQRRAVEKRKGMWRYPS